MIKAYLCKAKNNKRYGRTDITLLSPGYVCNDLVLATDATGLFVLRSKDEENELAKMAREHGEMLALLEETVAKSANDYDRCQEPNCWHCRARALAKRAVESAKDGGIFAGSLIAEENAEELSNLRDLLRWRKVGEETVPVTTTLILWHPEDGIRMSNWNRTIPAEIIEKSLRKEGVTHWRPIGPLPEVEE